MIAVSTLEQIKLQVSTDGYTSFGDEFSGEFAPIPLPSLNAISIIAPLWIPDSQPIAITNHFYYRLLNQTSDLSEVTNLIVETNQELVDFQPKFAIIATMFLNSPDGEPGNISVPNLEVSISKIPCCMKVHISLLYLKATIISGYKF